MRRAGFSNGTGVAGTFFELTGSGVEGYFLDDSATSLITTRLNSSTDGRCLFSVINGEVVPFTTPAPGAAAVGAMAESPRLPAKA